MQKVPGEERFLTQRSSAGSLPKIEKISPLTLFFWGLLLDPFPNSFSKISSIARID